MLPGVIKIFERNEMEREGVRGRRLIEKRRCYNEINENKDRGIVLEFKGNGERAKNRGRWRQEEGVVEWVRVRCREERLDLWEVWGQRRNRN